jgi:hypothetical protein
MKSNRRWVFAFWFYLAILMTISMSAYLQIIPTEISQFPHYDTVLHFVLIGFAAYLSHLALNKRKIRLLNTSLPLAPIIVIFCRLIDEGIQLFTPHRSFDLMDLAADLCGIVLFTWLAERQKLNISAKK